MRKPAIILSALFVLSTFLISCSGDAKDEIVGTWDAVDANAIVNDYTNIKDDVLDQALEYYRTVSFEFFEDFTMNIVNSGNSYPGSWKWDEEAKSIFIRMEQHEARDYKEFGVLKNDTIVSSNKTGIGMIVVKYVKTSDYN